MQHATQHTMQHVACRQVACFMYYVYHMKNTTTCLQHTLQHTMRHAMRHTMRHAMRHATSHATSHATCSMRCSIHCRPCGIPMQRATYHAPSNVPCSTKYSTLIDCASEQIWRCNSISSEPISAADEHSFASREHSVSERSLTLLELATDNADACRRSETNVTPSCNSGPQSAVHVSPNIPDPKHATTHASTRIYTHVGTYVDMHVSTHTYVDTCVLCGMSMHTHVDTHPYEHVDAHVGTHVYIFY